MARLESVTGGRRGWRREAGGGIATGDVAREDDSLAVVDHGGEDVAVYAVGPGADLFRGVIEQHYVYHVMAEALGWNQR